MAQEINALLRRLDTIAVRIVLRTHIFFHLESFLWKRPMTVEVRKKIIDQILGYISFCIEIRAHLGHLFA